MRAIMNNSHRNLSSSSHKKVRSHPFVRLSSDSDRLPYHRLHAVSCRAFRRRTFLRNQETLFILRRSESAFSFRLPPRTEDRSVPVVVPWCDLTIYCALSARPSLNADMSPCTGCYKLILLTLYGGPAAAVRKCHLNNTHFYYYYYYYYCIIVLTHSTRFLILW